MPLSKPLCQVAVAPWSCTFHRPPVASPTHRSPLPSVATASAVGVGTVAGWPSTSGVPSRVTDWWGVVLKSHLRTFTGFASG